MASASKGHCEDFNDDVGHLCCSRSNRRPNINGRRVVKFFNEFLPVYQETNNYRLLAHVKSKGIRFIDLYPPKCSHDLPPLAGLYTRKPFQSPEGYSRAAGSI